MDVWRGGWDLTKDGKDGFGGKIGDKMWMNGDIGPGMKKVDDER